MSFGAGNAGPCPGNWQPYDIGENPRPSVNSGPSWDFAIIFRDMYECMRISRGLSTRCYRCTTLIVTRK